ncbi:MAG: porin [Phenylobacterium sp.]|uniref:porin n=1 Tax=Phenylobacterium sp. TaxID=1871053 RepID=UPI001A190525|nr:porin [Phenylobacterium sp.]MBJ7412200.1 porin [Phenylobacterium sp.]
MNKNLFAAAAAVALLGSAVAANAQTVGHVGANYSRTDLDVAGFDADADVYQLEGAVRFDAGSLGAQVDGAITNYDGDETSFGVTGHLNTKVGSGLVGGFAGVETSDDITFWGLGLDAQANLGPATSLYGQAGYGTSDDLGDADFWAVRGEIRHFVSDNLRLQGSLGYTRIDVSGGDADGWNAGVEAEYQFAETPFSVVAGYDHFDSNDLSSNADTFRIGVRYTFGGTLKDRDQSGASLGSVGRLFGAGLVR